MYPAKGVLLEGFVNLEIVRLNMGLKSLIVGTMLMFEYMNHECPEGDVGIRRRSHVLI
jgi:hypothetical protein